MRRDRQARLLMSDGSGLYELGIDFGKRAVDYHLRRLNMPMKNPPHPGGFVLRQCIEPLGLTITYAAALGVTRTTLSELVNGKRWVSPEMAVRLSKVFGGSAEGWLTQQAQYDLAQVRADRIKLRRLALAYY